MKIKFQSLLTKLSTNPFLFKPTILLKCLIAVFVLELLLPLRFYSAINELFIEYFVPREAAKKFFF